MEGVYKYLILKNLKLIILFYQNNVKIEGLKKLKLQLIQDKNYNPNFRTLIDNRLISDKYLTIKVLEDYNEWNEKNFNSSGSLENVVLTKTPYQTSKSIYYGLIQKNRKVRYSIFTSLLKCLLHLNIRLYNLKTIENEIEKMRVKL